MKLVMTLLARNEADIVDAQLAFHLNAGVDFVVATDNGSDDGTLEILERYERSGHLHLLREAGDDMRQGEWVSRMARLAATELEADWVINSDADEFWWPRGGTLKDVLDDRAGEVRRRTRLLASLPPSSRWGRALRRAHDRAPVHARVSGRQGDDLPRASEGRAPGDGGRRGRGRKPQRDRARASTRSARGIPSRCSTSRSARRSRSHARRREGGCATATTSRPGISCCSTRLRAGESTTPTTDRSSWTTPTLERGVAEGRFAIDTRLRDALRLIRGPDGSFQVPRAGSAEPPLVSRSRRRRESPPSRRRRRHSLRSTES